MLIKLLQSGPKSVKTVSESSLAFERERLAMKMVIKIGTSTLAYSNGRLNIRRVEELCKVISDLKNSGISVIAVSSGAIGMGCGKLSMPKRPEDMATKQAAAAVGQCELMYVYDKLFSEYNHTVAQILITASDVKHDDRYSNFINTLNRLLELETIPIINENDTIATEEIVIGDNDTLAAIVATSVKADLLVLLSDIDGLYSADPHQDRNATLISEVHNLDEHILATAGGSGSPLGTGGMKTKLTAARMCMESGCDMVIMNGSDPDLLYRIADGEQIGTRFYAGKQVER